MSRNGETYSITEAESPAGLMFEEMGLEAAVRATPGVAEDALRASPVSTVSSLLLTLPKLAYAAGIAKR